ncbi:hypothetical protein JTB14_002971 [Gonioctena quinquepunctata]|nr:hypothetical protein JTB14_002971 [Gonioctena quinquepunctata]
MLAKLCVLLGCLTLTTPTFLLNYSPSDEGTLNAILQVEVPKFPLYHHDNNVYYIGTILMGTQTEGILFCRSMEMELVNVGSENENAFLNDTIASIVVTNQEYIKFHTSATRTSGSVWYWMDNVKPFSFTAWAPGAPTPSYNGKSKGCLALSYFGNSLLWVTTECDEMLYIICKGHMKNSVLVINQEKVMETTPLESIF